MMLAREVELRQEQNHTGKLQKSAFINKFVYRNLPTYQKIYKNVQKKPKVCKIC